jgi:hypothetical protein
VHSRGDYVEKKLQKNEKYIKKITGLFVSAKYIFPYGNIYEAFSAHTCIKYNYISNIGNTPTTKKGHQTTQKD